MQFKMTFWGLVALSALSVGCKSANDSTNNDVTISGRVMAGPTAGAQVQVADEQGRVWFTTTTTDADGNYSVALTEEQRAQTLLFTATGGSYTDEATGSSVNATNGLSAYVAANELSSTATSVSLTPETTIVATAAAQWATHHSSVTTLADRLTAARAAFSDQFGYSVDHSQLPISATSTPDATATTAQKKAGLRAASFSQLNKNLGGAASDQDSLLAILGQDLADGSLDGKAGSSQLSFAGSDLSAALPSQFDTAYRGFFEGTQNKTGLVASDLDNTAFGKMVKTSSYMVTYVPGSMAAMQGKTMFSLKVADHSGNAVSGASLALTPMMHMDSYSHSSPVVGCTESSTAGTHSCTLYYLMPSYMGTTQMGYWQLTAKVTKSGATESAVFYPLVKPSMSDTTRATLRHQTALTMAMSGGTEARYFFLFKNSLSGSTGSHTFSVYLATRESMMSFPAIVSGTTYNTGTSYAFTPTTITLQASTDASTWTNMTSSGSGVWTLSGISGLTSGTSGKIYIKATLDSSQLTTDGSAVGTSNGYATFTVTP
ncbi:MAG: hypothetical protein RRB13_06740 [bacterium]|nr:hypothetical protein [bacterium]